MRTPKNLGGKVFVLFFRSPDNFKFKLQSRITISMSNNFAQCPNMAFYKLWVRILINLFLFSFLL